MSDSAHGFPSSSCSVRPSDSLLPFEKFVRQDWRRDVLVIDDDIETSERVCGELRASGFNAAAAFSGEEGLALLDSRSFGLILLDWMLPGCNGIEVLKSLRARNDRTPVFLMSVIDA